jgi:hypothetical protein
MRGCGVVVARLSEHQVGTSLADRHVGNVGTARGRSGFRPARSGSGQARRRLRAVGRGGGLVVVRDGRAVRMAKEAIESVVRMLEGQEGAGEHRRTAADAGTDCG